MTTPEKSQARIRYERSHPHWSTRLPTDLSKDVDQILLETGMNKVQFIRWAVRAFREQGSAKQHNPSEAIEQMRPFFRLLEQGDPDIIAVVKQLNAAKLMG